MSRARTRIWELLEKAKKNDKPSRMVDGVLVVAIITSIISMVLSTEHAIYGLAPWLFDGIEQVVLVMFAVEYILRVWGSPTDKKFKGAILGRIRYMLTPLAVIDLLVILPLFLPFLGTHLQVLRIFRLVQLIRILKLGRYSESLQNIRRVIKKHWDEMVATVFVGFLLLVFVSTVIYFLESRVQPEAFGSIPKAMWWGIVTLTTVGYGDIAPLTPLGKVFGGLAALFGVSMFVMPAAILAAGFIDELEAKKDKRLCRSCMKEAVPKKKRRVTKIIKG